jgi:hypothetical protein
MVVSNTTVDTCDWYCHLVGDRASLFQKFEVIKSKGFVEITFGIKILKLYFLFFDF